MKYEIANGIEDVIENVDGKSIILFNKYSADTIIMSREGKYINLVKPTDTKKYFRYDMNEKIFERVNFYKTVDNKATEVSVKNITSWFTNCRMITFDKKFAKLVLFNKYHYDFDKFRNPVRFIEMLGNPKNRNVEEWESIGIKITDVEEWYNKVLADLEGRSYYYLRHSMRIKYPPSYVSKSLLKYIKSLGELSIGRLNELVENYNNGEYNILIQLMELEKSPKYANIFDIERRYYGNGSINVLNDSDDYRSRNIKFNMIKTIIDYTLDLESFCEWVKYQKNVEKNDIDFIIDHYNDYLRMELALKDGLKSKMVKYPKHFRDVRNRTIVEYRAIEEEISEQLFKGVVEKNKKLEYKGKKYSIVLPKESNDINIEAEKLEHCVRSYIKPMTQDKTLICFCRLNENLDEPLVTIEVKRNAVTQAYGKDDKKPTIEELSFIKDWAEKKHLDLAWCWGV